MFGGLKNQVEFWFQRKRLPLSSLLVRRLIKSLKYLDNHRFITDAGISGIAIKNQLKNKWALRRFLSIRSRNQPPTFRSFTKLNLSNKAIDEIDKFFRESGFCFFGLPITEIKTADILIHGLLQQVVHQRTSLTNDELENAKNSAGVYFGFFRYRRQGRDIFEGRLFVIAIEQLTSGDKDDTEQFGFARVVEIRQRYENANEIAVRLRQGPMSPSTEDRYLLLSRVDKITDVARPINRLLQTSGNTASGKQIIVDPYDTAHMAFFHIEFGKGQILSGKFMDETVVGAFALKKLDAKFVDPDLVEELAMGEYDFDAISNTPYRDILNHVPTFSAGPP